MRALGLEPSLFRGKNPVPYLSGVTRMVGREGIEPPVSDDGWPTTRYAPWRVRPTWGQMALALIDVSSVVKVLVPDDAPGDVRHRSTEVDDVALQARKESNPLPAVLETVAPPWLEPRCMDGTRAWRSARAASACGARRGRDVVRRWRTGRCGLPTDDGRAEFGQHPQLPIDPRISRLIELTR